LWNASILPDLGFRMDIVRLDLGGGVLRYTCP
jgi:hypothetical protein